MRSFFVITFILVAFAFQVGAQELSLDEVDSIDKPQSSINYELESIVGRTFQHSHSAYQDGAYNSNRLQISSVWTSPNDIVFKEKIYASNVNGFDRTSYSQIVVDELHATYNAQNDCTFRLGFQKVIWGQADRLRVVNVINPLDLRESYFNEWERKHLSLGMLNSECGFGNQSVQLLLIPQTRFYKFPNSYQSIKNTLEDNLNLVLDEKKQSTNDWNTGIRWSDKFSKFDVSVYGYRGYEQYRHPVFVSTNTYELQANKYTMLGADFTSAIGPFMLRGEVANKDGVSPYPIEGLPSTIDIQSYTIHKKISQQAYLLGLDYPGSTWNVSAQYLSQINHSVTDNIKNQQVLTLAGQKYFFNKHIQLGAYSAVDLKHADNAYLSLDAAYEVNDHWLIKGTTEFFRQADFFGQNIPYDQYIPSYSGQLGYQNRFFISVRFSN